MQGKGGDCKRGGRLLAKQSQMGLAAVGEAVPARQRGARAATVSEAVTPGENDC